MSELYIYSGDSLYGKVGDETNLIDFKGKKLSVGDIVVMWAYDRDPTLTFVADTKYQSCQGGKYKICDSKPFVMGIASVDFMADDSNWFVKKVKDSSSLIGGEYWPDFGFNVGLMNQKEIKND